MKAPDRSSKVVTKKVGKTTQLKSQTAKTIVDNRASTVLQRKLQQDINSSPRVLQAKFGKGLPEDLKANLEAQSGYSLDEVTVHYNSSEPAKVGALAYAQGTDIYLAPGQEKHLAHEAWHIIQQKQGKVRPTMQLEDGTNINDNISLEQEAERMGSRASFPAKKVDYQKIQHRSLVVAQQVTQFFKDADLTFTDSESKYATLKLDKYSLYGRAGATCPEPITLYIAESVTSDEGTKYVKWTPSVGFIQGRDLDEKVVEPKATLSVSDFIHNPLALFSSSNYTKVKKEIDDQSKIQARKNVFDELHKKVDSLTKHGLKSDSLCVVGKNDCAGWAVFLQRLIDDHCTEEINQMSQISFNLDEKIPDYTFAPGDSIQQTYHEDSPCPYHRATVVAVDGEKFITLEAHVSKNIDHPQFHIYNNLKSFVDINNTNANNESLEYKNGRKGIIDPLATSPKYSGETQEYLESIMSELFELRSQYEAQKGEVSKAFLQKYSEAVTSAYNYFVILKDK